MENKAMKKLILTLLIFCAFGSTSNAQSWDDQSWDDSSDDTWGNNSDDTTDNQGNYNYDQGSAGSTGDFADTSGGDDSWGSDDDDWENDGTFDFGSGGSDYVRSSSPAIEHRPYERFTGMPYDSASQLVTYVEIVEVIVPDRFLDLGGVDYSLSDSLYARAISWMQTQFGTREAKQMIDAAGAAVGGKEGQTIKAYVTMPLVVQLNKYQTVEAGTIEFDMELRFKDWRYRYKFENFVHVQKSSTGDKNPDETYMEYYMTAKRNIKNNDKILMACNTQMTKLIDGLRATCEATPFIDDDDW
ncbi:MAG: hypothetical protein ACJAXV_001390 [Bacteroidia bacterium]